jgi:integrase
MAKSYPRIKTQYPGVFIRETAQGNVFYIRYKRPGERKLIEDKLTGNGWTAAKANQERTRRIAEKKASNTERREQQAKAKQAEADKPTLQKLWEAYLEAKGQNLKGKATDINRFELHLKPAFGGKTPSEIAPLDVERLKRRMLKDHKNGTVRNVLELLRRIINHGVKMRLCLPLGWTIELPKVDPDSERIEVLTPEQFQQLNQVWDSYPDRHLAHLHKLIGWTGMRPSEPLRLKWSDIDFERNQITKHKTKSGKTVYLHMNETVRGILLDQLDLLEESPDAMRTSEFVFPTETGTERRRDSYKRHWQKLRELAGIPKEYRPNYCLRDTIASMMLSSGATLDEVGYQLGHEPGSPITRRYARFIPDAQKNIADKAEASLAGMLKENTTAEVVRLDLLERIKRQQS